MVDKSTDRAAHVNVSRNAIFSSRSTSRSEKNTFFDVEIVVKNKSNVAQRGLYSYRQRVHVITLFPNIFFLLFLHVERAKVFERKVWRVQVAHLHSAARALSCPSCHQILTEISFVIFDIVVKNKSNVV